MSTNDLPLDEAALEPMVRGTTFTVKSDDIPHLIRQARAALTLSARVAECVRAAAAVTGTDAEMCATEAGADTNHGVVLAALDWQAKRVAELEGELADERKRANDWMARVDSADHEGCAWMEHAIAQAREEGRREEREACAKVCEARKADCGDPNGALSGNTESFCTCDRCERCYEDDECAAAIRARGDATHSAADAASDD